MAKTLKHALQGHEVKGRDAEKALQEATGKIKRLEGAKGRAKELYDDAVEGAIHTAEGGISLAAASWAEGYFGDRIKLGGKVDARPAIGIPVFAIGLMLGASKKAGMKAAGRHVRAVSEGVVASWIGSRAAQMGRNYASKSTAPAQAAVQGEDDGLRVIEGGRSAAAGDQLGVGDALREILLTDASSATSGSAHSNQPRLVRANRL